MPSHLQKLKGTESFGCVNELTDPRLNTGEWIGEGPERESFSHSVCQEHPHGEPLIQDKGAIDFLNSDIGGENETGEVHNFTGKGVNVNSSADDGQTALHAAVRNGHLEMVRILLEGGANVNKPDASGWTPKALAEQQGNKSIYDLLVSCENRWILDEHKIEFFRPETAHYTGNGQFKPTRISGPNCSDSQFRKVSGDSSSQTNKDVNKLTKRVTIHTKFHKKNQLEKQLAKLIILPDSLEELFRIAGEKFGGYNLTKVVNEENAEIDDLSVVRDGDHLFLLENACEITVCSVN